MKLQKEAEIYQIKRESKLIKSKNLKEDKNIEKEKSEEDNIYSKKRFI